MGTYTNDVKLKKPNDGKKIWRYMDFTKFVSILHYKSLHFTRVDTFKDPYEASIASYFADIKKVDISEDTLKMLHEIQPDRQKIFANCWHINASESAALWKVYMKSNEGIAIQTTVKKLITVFETSKNDLCFDLASIEYDPKKIFSTSTCPEGKHREMIGLRKALFIKRSCFKYEHELRVFVRCEKRKSTGYDWRGLDINLLIESICVNPEAPNWLVSLVKDLAKSYEIEGKVYKSNIY